VTLPAGADPAPETDVPTETAAAGSDSKTELDTLLDDLVDDGIPETGSLAPGCAPAMAIKDRQD
jgi:hypothetical protein